jgi:hypothetical protein
MQSEEFDHDLILTFYSDFRRFENSLRKVGYAKDGHPAHADWDRFIGAIETRFDPNAEPEQIGAYLTVLDYAYKHGRAPRIKGAMREIILVSEIIQKMAQDLTRGTILRRHTETEIAFIVAATLILSAWADLEPNVKRIWNTSAPSR